VSIFSLLAAFFIDTLPLDYSGFQNDVAIRGAVVDIRDRRPIGGAVVYALGLGYGIRQTTSNAHGLFSFFDLPPGNYGLYAIANGYDEECVWHVPRVSSDLPAGFEYSATILLPPACGVPTAATGLWANPAAAPR
jgi:hypothetical protein